MAAKKQNRCWPGYEPVPSKPAHSQGSCRPKAESKSTPGEKKFRAKRKRQIDNWEEHHQGSPRKAAQHLAAPGAKASKKKATANKKTAAKKRTTATSRKRAVKRPTARAKKAA